MIRVRHTNLAESDAVRRNLTHAHRVHALPCTTRLAQLNGPSGRMVHIHETNSHPDRIAVHVAEVQRISVAAGAADH